MPSKDDRQEERFPACTLVTVTSPHAGPVVGVLEDVSQTGMAVSVELPFLAQDRVTISGKQGVWVGTVRHCTERNQDGAYQIGILLDASEVS
jgi:hypothetical protein